MRERAALRRVTRDADHVVAGASTLSAGVLDGRGGVQTAGSVDERNNGDNSATPVGRINADRQSWPKACFTPLGDRTQAGKYTMKKVKDLLRSGKLTIFEVLQRLSLEELDEAVTFLKKHHPQSRVCRALEAIIATSPLSEFQTLRGIYRRHCDSPPARPGPLADG